MRLIAIKISTKNVKYICRNQILILRNVYVYIICTNFIISHIRYCNECSQQESFIPGLSAKNRRTVYPPSGTVTVSFATESFRFRCTFPCSSSCLTSSSVVVSPSYKKDKSFFLFQFKEDKSHSFRQ